MDFQHAGCLDPRHVYLGGVLSPGASNGQKESSVVIAPFPAVCPQALARFLQIQSTRFTDTDIFSLFVKSQSRN